MTDYIVPPSTAGITLNSGDTMEVQSGGIATSTIVSSGSHETVYASGLAVSTSVVGSGTLTISAGGSGSATTLSGGVGASAYEDIFGTTTSDTFGIRSYGTVENGGIAISAVLSTNFAGGNPKLVVQSGGSTTATQLGNHGNEYVWSGANAVGTVVSSGGALAVGGQISAGAAVSSGGTATNTVVLSGGNAVVTIGGILTSSQISGGTLGVTSTGAVYSTTVSTGTLGVGPGGTAYDTTVIVGGIQVSGGGVLNTATMSAGGIFVTSGGGTINNVTLSGGFISALSTDPTRTVLLNNTIVLSGAHANLGANTTATNTVVSSGGSEFISAGGLAVHTTVYSGAVETVYSSGTASNTILSGGRLVINDSNAIISGLEVHSGGSIDVNYLTFNTDDSVSVTSGGLLTVTSGGSTVYTTQLAGSYTGDYFHTSADSDGTLILTEDNTPCYCPGTLIATDSGEVLIEDLAIGDCVINHKGEARAIKWIGHRSFSGRFIATKRDILPICFKAGSIGENVPRRDLWVSPHHAMYLNGVLIEAKDLINGLSIYQTSSVESVKYFHVELDSHDVIIAEGALAESFIDDNDRGMFHNAQDYVALYPETEATDFPRYYAPRIDSGEEVEAARASLNARSETYFGAALKSVA